jgi:hypothetical protein
LKTNNEISAVAVFKGRSVKFAVGKTYEELRKADVCEAVKLKDLVTQRCKLFVEVKDKLTRQQTKLLLDYFAIAGNIDDVFLFSIDEGGNWRYIRGCVGMTLANVARAIAVHYTSALADRLQATVTFRHPADDAVDFLADRGGHRPSLEIIVDAIGDMRHAMVKMPRGRCPSESLVDNLHVVRDRPQYSYEVDKLTNSAIQSYLSACAGKCAFDAQTFDEHLLLASAGLPRPSPVPGSLVADALAVVEEPPYGLMMLTLLSLRLIVKVWATNEFHVELFDEMFFHQFERSRQQVYVTEFNRLRRNNRVK